MTYTDKELTYAATARCRCGAGLAHPLETSAALKLAAWVCSKVLRGEVPEAEVQNHQKFPFAFWKIREEQSINNRGNFTTRPEGTVAMTVGRAVCPECGKRGESEPYNACGLSHHWFLDACPSCGYSVGGNGSYSSRDGEPIEVRYADVIQEKN